MAKLSARGRSEIIRYLDLEIGALCALMSDGHTLIKRYKEDSWHDHRKYIGPRAELGAYLERRKTTIGKLDGRKRSGVSCRCETGHNLKEWSKAGRPEPCPCPCPVPTEFGVKYLVGRYTLPSIHELESAVSDGTCETPCKECGPVEPDGECMHGIPSWLRVMHMI